MTPTGKDTGELSMPEQMGVVLERIKELQTDVAELKSELKCVQAAFDAFKMGLAERIIQMDSSGTQSARKSIDNHEERIAALERAAIEVRMLRESMNTTNKILAFLGTTIGALFLTLLWMFITGQAEVIFK